MKKITSLLISCSLTLAGAALAQQPDEQASPKPKQAIEKGKGHAPETKPGGNEMKPEVAPVERHKGNNGPGGVKMEKSEITPKPESTVSERHGGKNPGGPKMEKAEMTPKAEASVGTKTKLSGEPMATATPGAKKQADERRKGMKEPAMTATPATAVATATPTKAATATATPVTAASATATAAPVASATVAPSMSPVNQANGRGKGTGAAKKPEPQQVQQIKAEHANFRAQAKPDKVPAVTFNQNYRIEGSDRWQGQQYEAFRSYHPERHDESYYHSHYSRVELIGGGYYYQNNGYWYPAWGYRPSAEYYAYDGPIYVGHRAEPPDRVIADVQSALQQTGYYKGEVDGLLGPLTRQALTSYQEDEGLATTAAIDEPTLDSLGMG